MWVFPKMINKKMKRKKIRKSKDKCMIFKTQPKGIPKMAEKLDGVALLYNAKNVSKTQDSK